MGHFRANRRESQGLRARAARLHPIARPFYRSFIAGLTFLLCLGLLLPGAAAAETAAPAETRNTLVPLLPNGSCAGAKSATIFGLQVYGSSGRNASYFSTLQNSGASWVRVPVMWEDIEPNDVTPSQYQWAAVDNALLGARDACLNLIATIDHAPGWAAFYPRAPLFAHAYGDFAEFVGALVERYDGDGVSDSPYGMVVNHWEFYNEPDLGPQPSGATAWGNAGAQYAQMLRTIYPVVKAANPQAQVVFGGIAYDFFDVNDGPFVQSFLEDVLKAGGGDYFDIMNFHYYPAFRKAWYRYENSANEGTGLVGKTTAIRELLHQYGLNKPVVITEAGWHNNDHEELPSSDEDQSRYVVQFFAQSKALDLEFMIWWMLSDPVGEYQYATGLVTDTNPPIAKPAYKVYQVAAARLGYAEYSGTLTVAETKNEKVEVHRFTDPHTKKVFYVAWLNPISANGSTSISLSGETARVYDKIGILIATKQDAEDGANDGKVTVQVGGSPVYIVIN
ncbi:MAG TPA: cellulase family glycosylhydrolase [Caldilineaceae bacterium]|nr:cellulase family glycosylhydrolase [Caldilineaceae bacterium]